MVAGNSCRSCLCDGLARVGFFMIVYLAHVVSCFYLVETGASSVFLLCLMQDLN